MKIMLVDDNEISNFIMRKFLEKMGFGSDVVEYTDPEEALNKIKVVSPDLLFLDLQMPFIHGWQFLDQMKDHGINVCTVILTSSTSERDKERMKKYEEVIYYAEKPMTEPQLSEVMKLTNKKHRVG